jgi:hypothetical protein
MSGFGCHEAKKAFSVPNMAPPLSFIAFFGNCIAIIVQDKYHQW